MTAVGFSSFVAALEVAVRVLPSIHIGIVSTDLGAGPFNIRAAQRRKDQSNQQVRARSGRGILPRYSELLSVARAASLGLPGLVPVLDGVAIHVRRRLRRRIADL